MIEEWVKYSSQKSEQTFPEQKESKLILSQGKRQEVKKSNQTKKITKKPLDKKLLTKP